MSALTDTWPNLIAELSETALADIQTTCSNEVEFRDQFETACEEKFESDAQKLLGKFMKQHAAILTFTETVDAAQSFQSPKTLSDLFWQVAFATTQVRLPTSLPQHLVLIY
jgi:hypothetical protein